MSAFLASAAECVAAASGASAVRVGIQGQRGASGVRAAWASDARAPDGGATAGAMATWLRLPLPEAPEGPAVLELARAGGWTAADEAAWARVAATLGALWRWLHLGTVHGLARASGEDAHYRFRYDACGGRRYETLTQQAEHLTGRPIAVLLGDRGEPPSWVDRLVHPADRRRVRAHDERLRAGCDGRLDYRVLHTDGTERWLREHAAPERDEHGGVTVGGRLVDVTAEHEVAAALREATRRAEAASALRSSFLTLISHELRSPLGAIRGYTEALEQEIGALDASGRPLPPALREFAAAVRHNTERVLSLVSNVVHLASIAGGDTAVDLEAVLVCMPARAAAGRVRPLLEARGVGLVLDLAPDARAWADADRLEQVLDHLLANAVKFTAEGAVTMRVARSGRHVDVVVADTGVGLDAARSADLFVPFVQADAGLDRPFEGAGLGLALVKRLVELMGGQVLVAGTCGAGAAFTVRLSAVDLP